ncbi:unnamed protein product [Darwinula stevensoni]|uniref:EGF-like domain-containing protein n=1 Tax=Darwinula stevensoni TaxID=69355 RepID=A0A7R9AEQ0_9CRUS|nr:unnamed protein product [Darwinula stevensoni]CAG0902563.1 unnamed protein product [Darwinula stevensoni]
MALTTFKSFEITSSIVPESSSVDGRNWSKTTIPNRNLVTKQFVFDDVPETIDRPSNCPEINPNKNLWSILKQRSERDNTDPCFPNPCGAHAKCRASGGHPVCSCIYYGNPETSCFEGECVKTHDCSDDRVCKDFYCTDPCPGTCGRGAQCIVRRHVPVCTCPVGHTGDPFEQCRRLGPEELCFPSPCGRNSKCEVAFHVAICSCLPHFFGNPVQGCR